MAVSWAAARRSWRSLDFLAEACTGTTWTSGLSSRMSWTNLLRTPRGPNSTKTRAPASYMWHTWSRKRTGLCMWRVNSALHWSGEAGYSSAVTFEKTLVVRDGCIMVCRMRASKAVALSRMYFEWKAPLTDSRRTTRKPRSRRRASSASMPARCPLSTTWVLEL